ncbi:hypothetical protein IU514_11075 [Lysobacter niastensis]|uniref:Uncharacterized protein n=1 Tax=Lysobacter niastensis TaxID=380629 RepID=A0ABS0B6B4_9GAMM|nr:hypothetical protein [Lysobacter niastensis]
MPSCADADPRPGAIAQRLIESRAASDDDEAPLPSQCFERLAGDLDGVVGAAHWLAERGK